MPDVWAEFFVEKPKKDLDEYGLKDPAQTVSLKRPDGGHITLLIGKESRTKKRTVTRPAPPGLPMPPQQETVNEVYRYAKLQDNDQIFEIKPDKLNKDVFVAVDTLRDPRLARFRSEDARRVEISQGREGDVSPPMIVLVKDKDKWRLQKPQEADAEGDKINELIDRLSSLQARDKDVIAKADAKTYGFDQPAGTVKVTVEEEVKGEGDSKTKTTKVFTFVLGKHDADKKKLYVRMEGWDRVNAVDESGGEKSVPALVKRPTLAYRALQLWSWQPADLASVRVQKLDQEPYRLERKDRGWRISEPFEADAPASRVQPIETALAGLRCERFETQAAKELSAYELEKPYLTVTVTHAKKEGAEGKDRALQIGKPVEKGQKPGISEKPATIDAEKGGGRYAKLKDSDDIFVVSAALVAAVDKGPLDLLDPHLLSLEQVAIERIQSMAGLAVQLTLERRENDWQVVESPAPAFSADREAIRSLLTALSNVNAQRIVAYGPKAEWAKYGLDNPSQTITVTMKKPAPSPQPLSPAAGERGRGEEADAAKEQPSIKHTLALGKPVEGGAGERYARLDDVAAVAVLAPAAIQTLTRTYLDFVNSTVFQFDAAAVKSLQRQQGGENLEFTKKDGDWQMAPLNLRADDDELSKLIKQLSALKGSRIAAYPAKDPKTFGLDTPAAVWTVSLAGADNKPAQHVLKIGKTVDETAEDRFAQAEGAQAVAVIPGVLARRLLAAPVAFRNRELARFADADRIILERGFRKATFAKVEGSWKLTEPTKADAEQVELDELINAVARFRADELVADKAEDLKPYGLDRPIARWRFQSGDKDVLSVLVGGAEKIKSQGKEADGPSPQPLLPRRGGEGQG